MSLTFYLLTFLLIGRFLEFNTAFLCKWNKLSGESEEVTVISEGRWGQCKKLVCREQDILHATAWGKLNDIAWNMEAMIPVEKFVEETKEQI